MPDVEPQEQPAAASRRPPSAYARMRPLDVNQDRPACRRSAGDNRRRRTVRGEAACLLAILMLAAGLRFPGITEVGIRFEDEAAYVADARLWYRSGLLLTDGEALHAAWRGDKAAFSRRLAAHGVDFADRYFKPSQGYTLLGSAMMFVVGDGPAALLVLNALLGVLTVALVYLVARPLFGVTVGACSAFLLAVSPYHIMYARSALTESSSSFFCLLSVMLWLRWRERSGTVGLRYAAAGLAMGLAVSCHYRVLCVAPIPFIVDLMERWRSSRCRRAECADASTPDRCSVGTSALLGRWIAYACGLVLPILVLELVFRSAQLVAWMTDSYLPLESYLEPTLRLVTAIHSVADGSTRSAFWALNGDAVRSYPMFLVHFHGVWATGIAGLGVLYVLRRRGGAGVVGWVVVATAAVLIMQPYVVARALSTVLPFLSVCTAALVFGFWRRVLPRRSAYWSLLSACSCLVIAMPAVGGVRQVLGIRGQLAQAAGFLAAMPAAAAVVAEDPQKYTVFLDKDPHAEGERISVVRGQRYRVTSSPGEALRRMRSDGIRWLIADPQRWHFRDSKWARRDAVCAWWAKLEDVARRECRLVAEFPHVTNSRWSFLAEGPGTAYLPEMIARGDGPIRVYDVSAAGAAGRPMQLADVKPEG